jgi:PPOX class probable FMN-dependent enzyme
VSHPQFLSSAAHLEEILGHPAPRIRDKVRHELHACDIRWIAASPLCYLATSDRDGNLDVSPKGDPPGSVLVLRPTVLAIPERPGNRRGDGFHNVLENPGVALIFIVPGRDDALRVNGRAEIVRDAPFFDEMRVKDHRPALAMIVHVREVFTHCGRAHKRAAVWDPSTWRPDAAPSRLEYARLVEQPDVDAHDLARYYEDPAYGTNLYDAG